MNHILTNHALSRSASRSIGDADISMVLEYGEEIRQEGKIVYFLGEKRSNKLLSMGINCPKNIAVVVSATDGAIVSVIRTNNRHRLSKTKNKHKRRETPSRRYIRALSRL